MAWKNVNVHGSEPCSICDTTSNYCAYTEDGTAVICRRVDDASKGAIRRVDRTGSPFWLYLKDSKGPRPDLDAEPPESKYKFERADATTLHAVYTRLLGLLRLDPAHETLLCEERKYTRKEIEEIGFKTWPVDGLQRDSLKLTLKQEFGTTLHGVPGFFLEEEEQSVCTTCKRACALSTTCKFEKRSVPCLHLVLPGAKGYVIPQRDLDGRIVGLQLRLDAPLKDGGRYLPISSTAWASCGGGLVPHVPAHAGLDTSTVAITEGIHKANTATLRTNVLTIALPSVGAIGLAMPILEELGAKRVLLMLDADARTNLAVAGCVRHAAQTVASQGYTLAIPSWTLDIGKGIDDVINAEKFWSVEMIEGLAIWRWLRDVSRAARAPTDATLEARIRIFDLPQRAAGDSSVAFRKEVLSAVATMDPKTAEMVRFMDSMKAVLPGKFTSWTKQLDEARSRQCRERREQGARERGQVVFRHGDHSELSAVLVERLSSLDSRYSTERKARLETTVTPVYADGALHTYRPETGTWNPLDESHLSKEIMSWSRSPVGESGELFVNRSTIDGTIKCAYDRAHDRRFFETAAAGIAFKDGFVVLSGEGAKRLDHKPEHRARFAYPFDYVPGGKPGKLLAAMEKMFQHDKDRDDKIALIQEFGGVSRLGLATKHQVVLVFYGPLARDGKTTLAAVIARSMPPGSVVEVSPDLMGERFQLADLAGKLLNIVDEIPTRPIDRSEVFKKVVTAKMDLRAERKNRDPFMFRPVAGHLLCGNHLPNADDPTEGFFRRFLVIDFNHQFTDAEDIKGIEEEILTEQPEIVSWFMEGAVRVLRRGAQGSYTLPASAVKTKDEWKRRADPVIAFVHENCVTATEERDRTKLEPLYEALLPFLEKRGHKRMAMNTFGNRLRPWKVRESEGNSYALKLKPTDAQERETHEQKRGGDALDDWEHVERNIERLKAAAPPILDPEEERMDDANARALGKRYASFDDLN